LLGTAVSIALPILRIGYLTYIDNAVHLAEVYDLARGTGNGWSELAFAGFPLTTLHSPIWYPLLARLTRAGAPLEPIYAGLLMLGFAAPALALYAVARRRTSPMRAGVLAYLVLVQPSMIWGIGSPLGGMWTNALASAALVLLADLLSRPALTAGQHWAASALLAFAVLTHLFVLPLAAMLAAITTALHLRAGSITRGELLRRIAGWALAGLASAQYWLTLLWVGNQSAAPHQAFHPLDVLVRLLLPADPMLLLNHIPAEAIRWDLHLTDAVPMLLVVGLGVVGAARRTVREDPLVRVGFSLGLVVLGSLLVDHYFPLGFLGPVSWRLIEWVRIGAAFAAIAAVTDLRVGRLARLGHAGAVAAALAATASGLWWGLPLRRDCPASLAQDVERANALFAWLEQNASPDWGRLYLQDTFGRRWREAGLAHSHLLALASHHVGLPQIGTYYGVVPYKLRWTLSEFDTLFTTWEPTRDWVVEALGKTNSGVIVASNRETSDFLAKTGEFDDLYSVSRYTVWRLRGASNHPVAELGPTNHVGPVELQPGELRFDLRTEYPAARVLAKTAWHPWWHLEGIPGAWLRESPEGFLVIDDIPSGEFHVRLWYEPSPLPRRLTLAGWSILLGLGLTLGQRALRARTAPAARAV
jgi:hypothetical protein